MSSQEVIQGTKSVSLSAVTIGSGTYIFYFSLESNKLRFCLADGSADTVVKAGGVAITASNNARLAAVPRNKTEVCGA